MSIPEKFFHGCGGEPLDCDSTPDEEAEAEVTLAAKLLGQIGGGRQTPEQKRALDIGRKIAHRMPRTDKQLGNMQKARAARKKRAR
jgi:hypothetical protein